MSITRNSLKRPAALFAAAALLVGTAVPSLLPALASADTQATVRSITLTNSTPGAAAEYDVTFTPATSEASGELVVDFCDDTPLIGATCSFSAASVPTVGTPVSNVGTAAAISGGTPTHALKVTGLTLTAGTPITVKITSGITNPTNTSTTGNTTGNTFYGRILTYATGGAASYVPASSSNGATTKGSDVDFGGVALSTNQQVTITARVMESLTFCASGIDISGAAILGNNSCAQATAPALDIGQGSPTKVLDASRVDTGTAFTQLSTNATSGAVIRMKATNTCANAGLGTTPSTCNIPGVTSGAANGSVAGSITAGTAAFGLFVSTSALTTGVASSSGTITPDANYYNAAHTNEATGDLYYGMDNRSASPDGVLSVYGDVIASAAAPLSRVNNHLVFGITPSLTTPAGIYTGNEILIATGVF